MMSSKHLESFVRGCPTLTLIFIDEGGTKIPLKAYVIVHL